MDSTCLPEMPRRTFMAIIAGGLLGLDHVARGVALESLGGDGVGRMGEARAFVDDGDVGRGTVKEESNGD